jgi:nucleotide-binding universal stress UspA family protein
MGPALPNVDSHGILEDLRSRLAEFAEEIRAQSGASSITTTVTEQISASGGIVKRLLESDADLVVLGTRGRTGLKGIFLGTTAERLIHDSPCSALTVKPEGFTYKAN